MLNVHLCTVSLPRSVPTPSPCYSLPIARGEINSPLLMLFPTQVLPLAMPWGPHATTPISAAQHLGGPEIHFLSLFVPHTGGQSAAGTAQPQHPPPERGKPAAPRGRQEPPGGFPGAAPGASAELLPGCTPTPRPRGHAPPPPGPSRPHAPGPGRTEPPPSRQRPLPPAGAGREGPGGGFGASGGQAVWRGCARP